MGLPLNDNMDTMTYKLIEKYAKWKLEENMNNTEYVCIGKKQSGRD